MNGERPVRVEAGRRRRCHVGRRRDRQRVTRGLRHAEAPRADEPAKSAGHDGRDADGQRGEEEPSSVEFSRRLERTFFASDDRRLRRLEEPGQRVRTCERADDRGDDGEDAAGRTFECRDGAHGREDPESRQPDPRPADRRDAQDGREDEDHDDHPDDQRALVVRAERADRERLQPFGRRVDHGAADGDERRRLVVDEGSDDLGDPKGEERGQDADDRAARPRRLRSLRRRRRGFAEGSHDDGFVTVAGLDLTESRQRPPATVPRPSV